MIIATKDCNTAAELLKAVKELCTGQDLTTVHLMHNDWNCVSLTLFERTLSDSSKVYDLIIC